MIFPSLEAKFIYVSCSCLSVDYLVVCERRTYSTDNQLINTSKTKLVWLCTGEDKNSCGYAFSGRLNGICIALNK